MKQNVFVKEIPESMTPQGLETMFSVFGKVKSTKISTTPFIIRNDIERSYEVDMKRPPKSNGYGFVCF